MLYTETHDWILTREDGSVTIGVSRYAAEQLGTVVYLELPKVGARLEEGETVCVLESTKAAADLYAPLAGEVVEVNHALVQDPDLIRRLPESEGWLYRLVPARAGMPTTLLDKESYLELVR